MANKQFLTHRPHFCPEKYRMLLTSAAYVQVYFRPDFIMQTNTMNPDQQSDLGLYCF